MTLPPLKLVLTAAGCPGASTLIRMLKANGEREIVIHGVDMRPDAVGRFLCDGFSLVPAGASPEYIPALAAVVERERPDLLFVQSSHEIETVARHRDVFEALGARVLADGVRGIEIASDKARHARRLQRDPGAAAGAAPAGEPRRVRRRRPRARLPGRAGVLQAAGRQGLARLPHPLRARSTASTSCSTRGRSTAT